MIVSFKLTSVENFWKTKRGIFKTLNNQLANNIATNFKAIEQKS